MEGFHWKDLGTTGRVLVIGLATMIILNVCIIFFGGKIGQQDFKNPLSDYSKQIIQNSVEGAKIPTVVNGADVTLTGRRCNSYNQAINVTFVYTWKTANPDDNISVPGLSGSSQRAPGCVDRSTQMTMPPAVYEATEQLLASNPDGVEWYVEALETPIDDEGDLGQIKYWRTNDFTVIADPGRDPSTTTTTEGS